MPRTLTSSPVVLASDAISIIALDPSTKLHNIFGFMCLAAASSTRSSGVACGFSGLFLPLPAHTTSNARSRAKSTSRLASADHHRDTPCRCGRTAWRSQKARIPPSRRIRRSAARCPCPPTAHRTPPARQPLERRWASTITSTGRLTSNSASSTATEPPASMIRARSPTSEPDSGSAPDLRSASSARPGDKPRRPRRCCRAIRATCAMKPRPIWPAPTNPTRIGLPRAFSRSMRRLV